MAQNGLIMIAPPVMPDGHVVLGWRVPSGTTYAPDGSGQIVAEGMDIGALLALGFQLTTPATTGYTRTLPITPSDSDSLSTIPESIYVGIGGNLNVLVAGDGSPTLFNAVPTGTVLPIRAEKVLATGTNAGQIVGLII